MEHQDSEVESRTRLGEAMDALDPGARKLMELWLAGRSDAEIATELGLSADVVSTLCSAAVRQLQELLARLPEVNARNP